VGCANLMATAVFNQNLAPELKAQTIRDRLRLGRNFFWTAICVGASFLTLIPLFSIIFLVVSNGIGLLTPSVFFELPPAPGQEGGGLGNAIQGTALMVGIAILIAAPLGILSAIYISEYDKRSMLAGAVRFIAKLLTGIPSIICGMFAFATIVVSTHTKSSIAGGVALAVLALPTILLTAEQALLGVPHALREASYGMGATKFQTIFRVVLPEAVPAIMTGLMLAVARAAGETAPILFTATSSAYWLSSLMEPTQSLAELIYRFGKYPYPHLIQLAWTASLVLVVLVTLTNVTAQLVFAKRKRR
jgi:phosphate transport system permease protein